MINLPMQIELDTTGAQRTFESFAGEIQDISAYPVAHEPSSPPMQGSNNDNDARLFTATLSLIPQKLSDIVDYIRKLSESTDRIKAVVVQKFDDDEKQDPNPEPKTKPKTQELPEWISSDKSLIASARSVSNEINTALRGDVSGFVTNGLTAFGNSALDKNSLLNGGSNPSKLLAGLGVGAIVSALAAGTIKELEGNYEDALPSIDTVLTNFGGDGANLRSADVNSAYGIALWTELTNKNKGTGLSNEDFVSLVGNLGSYGINDITRAGDIAAQSAKWSRYTGVDSSTALNFAGLVERYGGNGTDALSTAYAASRASGLEKNQFGEFLTGLQSVIENGISRGFVKSADDVASQLTLLANISGNSDVWKGQQGASRYNQMASGMAANASLSTSSSLLLYKAIQESGTYASYTDVLSQMESGDVGDYDFLKKLQQNVSTAYSGDRESMIASYKDIFGLNWTGAIQIYDMLENLSLDTNGSYNTDEIKGVLTNVELKSDTTKLTDLVSDINQKLVNLGQGSFSLKVAGLDSINSTLSGVYNTLVAKNYEDMVDDVIDGVFTEKGDKEAKKAYKEKLVSMLKNPKTSGQAIDTIDALSLLDEGQKYYLDHYNILNNGNINPDLIQSIPGLYVTTANSELRLRFPWGNIPDMQNIIDTSSSEDAKKLNTILSTEESSIKFVDSLELNGKDNIFSTIGKPTYEITNLAEAIETAFINALKKSDLDIYDSTPNTSSKKIGSKMLLVK